ncbi:helix-turn-helix domain-containing protein [Acinetobacter baumannii]
MGKIKSNLHILMGEKKIRSINQLSKDTGISRPTLTRIYNDQSDRIEFETIYKLCNFFGCSVGELFTIVEDNQE